MHLLVDLQSAAFAEEFFLECCHMPADGQFASSCINFSCTYGAVAEHDADNLQWNVVLDGDGRGESMPGGMGGQFNFNIANSADLLEVLIEALVAIDG